MKKLNLYLLLCLFLMIPVVQSCDDDDSRSLGDFVQRMATVRVISGYDFYLETDNGQKLWIGAPIDLSAWYRPVDGQRAIVNYTILWDGQGEYTYDVKLNGIWDVLTKVVEDLTETNEDMYGNDKIYRIADVWVGGNYLNMMFDYRLPVRERHRVSLVRNTTVVPEEDGYIHLEFRYNDENDVTNTIARGGMVSYNLGDYAPSLAAGTYRGIKLHVDSEEKGAEVLTYEFANPKNEMSIDSNPDNLELEGEIK